MRKLVPLLILAAAVPLVSGCAGVFIAGAGATVLMADDRRTAGIYVEDENIEWKAVARFNSDFPDATVLAVFTKCNRDVNGPSSPMPNRLSMPLTTTARRTRGGEGGSGQTTGDGWGAPEAFTGARAQASALAQASSATPNLLEAVRRIVRSASPAAGRT